MGDRRILLILLIVLGVTHQNNAQGWPTPQFTDANTPGIALRYVNENVMYALAVDEEISTTPAFRLVDINYSGTGTPVVDSFAFGSSQFLQLTILQTNGQWSIYVNNRQDYENTDQQYYIVRIRIQGDATATNSAELNINIENLFDNNPTITYDGPCHALELQADQETNCTFKVFHPDGISNNPFRLVIEGSNNEVELFEFSDPVDLADGFNREYKLIVAVELRFERRAMYSFSTQIFDVEDHENSITTIVQVQDIPSMPPAWITPFATARFDEKTTQNFQVEAVDGDTDINKRIEYRVAFFEGQDYSEYIEIDQMTGNIIINPINRDLLQQEVFPFQIVAYKFDNVTWDVTGDAVIIVDDINDNMPEITASPNIISFKEATYLTLPLEHFIVNDIDLGTNATYFVSLESASTEHNFIQPFTVIPDKGYQESSFTITISDIDLLDYEVEAWQKFTITIVATEEENAEHLGQFSLQIELINWNDELPIFAEESYSHSVYETVPENTFLLRVFATDRDIGDSVVHSIVGRTDLTITPDGSIYTNSNDTFDYERQTSVLVQIMATDTLETYEGEKLNTVYTQLLIEVLDVNDKTPEMRMPRVSPRLMENSVGGIVVTTDGINATDPDGTADLFFTIDWNESYATKSGQEAEQALYENCFIIEADKTDHNRVIGYLMVNPEFERKIDYESYEVIYLSITVTDHNQEENDNSAEGVLTIRIDDENDNKPEFILDTLDTNRNVVEEASEGTIIGTIFALDKDGPFNNVITYSISPNDGTPDGLVEINPVNGVITVKANIDCDDPRIEDLVYTVTLNDNLWETQGEIKIHIIDINNKSPTFLAFEKEVRLYENITTGDPIERIITTDMDRDPPHNTVQHLINFLTFPQLGYFFEIDPLSGLISVRLQGETKFDRDHGETEHDIYVEIEDNFQGNGRKNADNTMIKLVLLDVNDNAPEMPLPSTFRPTVSENSELGQLIGTIVAIDIDDEDTPNAQVGYALLAVVPGTNTPSPLPADYAELFEINDVTGVIRFKLNPKGYYGTWMVTIEAYDHGHNWDSHIQLRSNEIYEVTVDPYNFNAPAVVNPTEGRTYRLSFASQQVNRPLLLADGTDLPHLEATDADGGIYGDVSFEIVDNIVGSEDSTYFEIIKTDNKRSQIYLKEMIQPKFYKINIRAEDGGGRQSTWVQDITFFFVDLTGEPVFEISSFQTDFTENIDGMTEERTIPEAMDPKNVGIDDESLLSEVFYFIDASYRPDDAILFQLDPITRVVTLRSELDRENIDNHEFRVIATNLQNGPDSVREGSYLIVYVSVNDVNDNAPTFEYGNYGSGITVTDQIGKTILTVKATDADLDDVIRYIIKPGSLEANGENLAGVLATAFELNIQTGLLTLNFGVLSTMKGFIEFQIEAFDLVDNVDTCDVKIFIISESNRVKFVFLNDKETVDERRERIAIILSDSYKYDCNIDDVSKAEENGVAQDHITDVRAHFIQNNEAIEADLILARSNDVSFITSLKAVLLGETINLLDVPNLTATSDSGDMEAILQILLIVVTVVLGLTLIGVIGMYVVRVRRLNRQLRAMSTTCDIIETKSKRMDLPTSNMFSEAGSNPVLNNNSIQKNQMFDTLSLHSESSDDQDFVGIDNDPTFVPTGKITGANLAVINGLNKRISPHNGNAEDKDRISDTGVYRF